MMLKQEILEDIINRIVETARPERIILFGSAARGEMGPNSDVDLLIIRKGGHSRKLVGQIYRKLHGVGAAVDAVMVSPADVERYKDSHALIIKPALAEGIVVYDGTGLARSQGSCSSHFLRQTCDESWGESDG